MINRNTLVEALDEMLAPESGPVEDVSNNGLQVEGIPDIHRAVFGVDACQELFESAADLSADFIFVHHGVSWGGGIQRFTGTNASRLKLLFNNSINLYASHLPLDKHPGFGHNARIAKHLGIEDPSPFFEYENTRIGFGGDLPHPTTADELAGILDSWLDAQSCVFGESDGEIEKVGIVSGGGADAINACSEGGYDCLITGEMKHSQYHTARELGVIVIAAGHYRTETPGVRAVMDWVEEHFGVECSFVNLPTGL